MDIKKENKLLRKRNAVLAVALEDANSEIDRLKALNADDEQHRILENLKSIENEWKQAVADLKEQREKYTALNKDLIEIKKNFLKRRG